ncbi:MAG: leucine-rich repeat protein [Acutalibacteraceae bacterium]
MKKRTRVISILLALIMVIGICPVTAVTASAADETVYTCGIYEYTLTDKGAAIVGCNGTDRSLTIPSTLDGNKVVEIGECVFLGAALDSLTIPEGVTTIRQFALADSEITDISFPKSLNTVEKGAFDDAAFFVEAKKKSDFYIIGDGLLYWYNKNRMNIVVPDTVKTIPEWLFNRCFADTVVLSENITEIPTGAFQNSECISITLGSRVRYIHSYAFTNCANLESITIPDSVQWVSLRAFKDCTSLKNVDLGKIDNIATSLFENCTSLESLTLPDGIIEIRDAAFKGCTALDNLVIPDGCTLIAWSAFQDCTSLKNLTVPKSVKSIEGYAFDNTPFLASHSEKFVILGDEVLVKYNGTDKKVNIPDGVKKIAPIVFYRNEIIEHVTIPDTVTEIGTCAFDSTAISELKLPRNLEIIGSSAFRFCSNITEVSIPGSVKVINDSAFCLCQNLKTIVVPRSVEEIKIDAFAWRNDEAVFYGFDGSYIQQYAAEKNLTFSVLPDEGDINADGKVSLIDAVTAQKAALKLITFDIISQAVADINCDSRITVFDAISIQKLSLHS